ncbi:MAG: 1,2-phenylacetyl-CoA epoxidase subunit B [Gammaproteobacteria bacterium]|nr:MAG: 1,2-phenylacetyl-CoA epoxidase subunit B [Gammaproteobacteria bacterium]
MSQYKLYEVFIRAKAGLSHQHVGSLHATDGKMALQNARDLYTRRSEGVSIWVVPSEAILAMEADERASFIEPSDTKIYRHPTFYDIPEEVGHM